MLSISPRTKLITDEPIQESRELSPVQTQTHSDKLEHRVDGAIAASEALRTSAMERLVLQGCLIIRGI